MTRKWQIATLMAAVLAVVAGLTFAQSRAGLQGQIQAAQALQQSRTEQAASIRIQSTPELEDAGAVGSSYSPCFSIPADAYFDGGRVLLNKCTGEVWRFDDGWSTSEKRYTRPYRLKKITRDE